MRHGCERPPPGQRLGQLPPILPPQFASQLAPQFAPRAGQLAAACVLVRKFPPAQLPARSVRILEPFAGRLCYVWTRYAAACSYSVKESMGLSVKLLLMRADTLIRRTAISQMILSVAEYNLI